MSNLLKRLFGRSPSTEASEEVLALQAEARRMKLAIEEAQAKIARLEADLARQQRSAEASREAALQTRLTQIFSDLAGPAAQFWLQLDLAENPEHPLKARDTLAVARGLLRSLENHGLEVSVPAGTTVPYDPAQHEPLSSMDTLRPGQPVRVRLPGLAFRGQRLRKAGVAPQEE